MVVCVLGLVIVFVLLGVVMVVVLIVVIVVDVVSVLGMSMVIFNLYYDCEDWLSCCCIILVEFKCLQLDVVVLQEVIQWCNVCNQVQWLVS